MDATKSSEDIVTIDVHAAKGLLSSGHRYVDVRTIDDFNKGHVDNALNVPYYLSVTKEGKVKNPEFLDQVLSIFSKDDHLVVGCNSGGRSVRACVDLLNAGFINVKNMGGGYSAWIGNGLAGDTPEEALKTSCKFRP